MFTVHETKSLKAGHIRVCYMRRVYGTALFLFAILFLPLLGTLHVSARVVDSVDTWDLIDSSLLSDGDWQFNSEKGWSGDAAEYTTGMSADSKISFTHSRPLNLQSSYFWAQDNSSEYGGGAVGAPDSSYSWSLGPEIVVNTFDVSSVSGTEIESISIVIAINIPDQLTQDSVRFSIAVDGQSELIKTWAHTTSGVDRMADPYWELNVSDDFDWDWNKISNAEITLDYVSVGGTDDTQLQVDAAGFNVIHRKSSWGLETSVASTTLAQLDAPIMDLNFTKGSWSDLTLASCGMQAANGTLGTWVSEVLERPKGQTWGRISNLGTWNGTIEARSSNDAVDWVDWQSFSFSEILPDKQFLQVRATLDDGCLERVRVDINDPTLEVVFNVHGDISAITANQSLVQVSLGGELAIRYYLEQIGSSTHLVSVGDLLPEDGEPMDVSLATAFVWDDGGNAMDLVVEVTSIKIDGAYAIEWDEAPECEALADVDMVEDGGGRLIPLICHDDITAEDDLEVIISSDNEDLVVADMSQGQIRLRLIEEASGQTVVSVVVKDRLGMAERNVWSQQFIVDVSPFNDPPFLQALPAEIFVSMPQAAYQEIEFGDVDDESASLSITFDYSWASWNGEVIKIQPAVPGEWQLTVFVSDGENTVSRVVNIVAQALPDLYVESVEADGGVDTVSAGDVVEVVGWVRNDGQEDAHFISIRCLADGHLFDVAIIDLVSPGQLRRAVCDWEVPADDNAVMLTVVVDYSLEIRESNEENNEAATTVAVITIESGGQTTDSTSSGISNEVKIGATAAAIMGVIVVFLLFAPKGIRKIE